MLTYEEALAKILATTKPLPKTTVQLNDMLGHVLAEPVVARFDLPPFDNSAVDGYGVQIADVDHSTPEKTVELKLLGEMRAGAAQNFAQTKGTAIKILTGATVPPSTEAVVMREYCEESDGKVRVGHSVSAGENIRRKGAEVRAGAEVIAAGTRINPPVLALIATIGEQQVSVHRKPRVGVVITGDELVLPGTERKPGQIFDSNSHAIKAAIKCIGIDECRVYYAKDSLSETKAAFAKAMEHADVVISSGGVSVGDHDYVKAALEELNVESIFWRIAIKPGKPVFFGTYEQTKLVFGLPGNPVSVLVTYHQLVKPALKKMMGCTNIDSPKYRATISTTVNKKTGRLDFLRAKMKPSATGISVSPARGQDSHMLTGLAAADCLLHFAADAEVLPEGSDIPFQFLNWFD